MKVTESISKQENRQSLISSAKDLFLKYGIKSVSMDDIASILGKSKKTIYNLVLNKSKLVEAVVKQYVKEEKLAIDKINQMSQSAIEEMILIVRQSLKTISLLKPTVAYDLKKYHKNSWAIIESEHYSHIEQTIETNINRGIREGYYRNDLDPKILSKLYMGLAKVVSNEDLSHDPDMTVREVFDAMINYHLHAITNEKGKKELEIYLNREAI